MGRNAAAGLPDKVTKVHDLDKLKQRLIDVWHGLGQNIIGNAIDEWHRRLCACIRAKWGHFEHLLWLKGHAYDNFSLLSLWILKENYCYCDKYVRFFIFCISQGSAATHLRSGGKYNKSFTANFLLSPAVKEFLKSSTFPKVMLKNMGDSFFWLTVYRRIAMQLEGPHTQPEPTMYGLHVTSKPSNLDFYFCSTFIVLFGAHRHHRPPRSTNRLSGMQQSTLSYTPSIIRYT